MKRLLWLLFIFFTQNNPSCCWRISRKDVARKDEERARLLPSQDSAVSPLKGKEDRSNECPICTDELLENIRTLLKGSSGNVCGHRFHEPCLREWEERHAAKVRANAKELGEAVIVIYTCPECQTPYDSEG